MKHDVNFEIPERALGKTDVEFRVWVDGDKLGTLRVSKGALVWFPKDRKTWGHKALWTEVDEFMQTVTRREKR